MTVNGANSERSSEPVGPAAAPTATLARFVAELRYDDLPESAREATRDLLLDAIGCALAGYESEETPLISDFVRELGQSQESSVIGGEPLSLAGATLLNGYLITAITACDVYRPAHCHMTPEIVPPALAIAERDGLDGKQLLTALAAGFEAAIRVSVGLHYPAFRERGWHSPGVVGPFGAAAATGKLLGLNADQQRMAFGLAGSQSAGTFANWGTPAVKFHQARAALSGLMAGLLAEKGFLASPEILAHPDGGLFKAYTDAPRPAEAVAELGQHWELENVALRLWPTGSRIQVMITALFELIERYDVRPDDVERLRVVVDPDIKAASGSIPRPRGTFEAMLSAHYVSAVVLHDRELWLDQFGPARYNDPALRQFIDERVEVEADPSLPRTSCRVEVRTRDGRDLTVRADAAKGDPDRPVTPEELTKKFRQCAAGRLPTETTEQALEMLLRIEEVPDIGELMRLLGRR